MTDALPPDPVPLPKVPPGSETAAARTGRWVKVVLAVSLALNLAVAGLALGAWLQEGPGRGMPRGLSFGPFSEALSPDDKRALRQALTERAPDMRGDHQAARADMEAVLTALRADPFDPAGLTAALAQVEARLAGRLTLGRSLIESRLLEMTDADRQAFADRLERTLRGKP
jgi:uncharacterized membrane protein